MPQRSNFEWDRAKSEANRAIPGRGFAFDAVVPMFDGPTLERVDGRKDYEEERIIAFGAVGEKILAVVFTWRAERRRIISARFANHAERQAYRAWLSATHPE
jgi:uncharacterized DUF497 family protein